MEGLLNFAKDNYVLFLILGIFFALALIGYFYDKYQHRDIKIFDAENSEDTMLNESMMEEKKEESVLEENPINNA